MYNYNIISDEKSYLEGRKLRKEKQRKEYEEKCRKLAQKWAIIFDRGAMNGELHRMFKDELLKNGIKKAFDVMDLFDEYID